MQLKPTFQSSNFKKRKLIFGQFWTKTATVYKPGSFPSILPWMNRASLRGAAVSCTVGQVFYPLFKNSNFLKHNAQRYLHLSNGVHNDTFRSSNFWTNNKLLAHCAPAALASELNLKQTWWGGTDFKSPSFPNQLGIVVTFFFCQPDCSIENSFTNEGNVHTSLD